MTELEGAKRIVARLPDSELELVLGFLAWRDCLADIDEWGDMRALLGRDEGGALRDLDEAERAEFGETLWESWQRLEREGKIDPKAPEPPPSAGERARRQRKRAEGLLERMLPADMPVVLAFLSWRARRSLRPRRGPAAKLAAAGAEAMRLIGEAEHRIFGRWRVAREEIGMGIAEEDIRDWTCFACGGELTQAHHGDYFHDDDDSTCYETIPVPTSLVGKG